MRVLALNTAIDTRKWARTETDASSIEPHDQTPPAPSREDEQRYQQTAPSSSDGAEDGED